MPPYIVGGPVNSCALGEKVPVWSMEMPAVGVTGAGSVAVAIVPLQGRHGFSVNGVFAGDPQGMQIDVQGTANNSSDTNWDVIGTITQYDPTNFTFYANIDTELPFVRLYMHNRGASVNVGAIITRY